MRQFYQIQQFAELAGVTVKALRHYDRLGLLKPGRTSAGYRLYTERDLERLEQILALKFLGLPLKQIQIVLDRPPLELSDALRLQRRALEEKQHLLGQAIRAIRAAEGALEPGQPADPAILKRIIEVIDMQDGIDAMKKYYSTEEAWRQRRRYYEEGPSPEWQELYREAGALLDEDPGSEQAQALADRWLQLSVRAWSGDPEVQTDSVTAWLDRQHWPPALRQRLAEFNLEKVRAFIEEASVAYPKRFYSEAAWARLVELRKQAPPETLQARFDLCREITASLDEDPSGERAQALAARWRAMIDAHAGGDPEIRAGFQKTWAERRYWPATMRWTVAAVSFLSDDAFEKVADFIDRAEAARAG